MTISEDLDVDQYPLPNPTDLLASVANAKIFSKLDLSQAYQQMLLDSKSEKYLMINTHLGLYQVTLWPCVFQRAMDIILQGIPGVAHYIDDILVTGDTKEQHLDQLEQVLRRLHEFDLWLKLKKCDFLKPAMEYLGYGVYAHRLHALPSKAKAIVEAPKPKNVQEI